MRNRLKTTISAAIATLLLALSSVAAAQEFTAADYVTMDLQARQFTLDGVRDRLFLLQLNAGLDAQMDQNMEIQEDVETIYQSYGMTASSALAWATQNREAITGWLTTNPNHQAEYDRIARELEAVSNQIQALETSEGE
jgi:hypothetical protein